MEFFNRLLRRGSINAAQSVAAGITPKDRLNTFKKRYADLLTLWRNGEGVSRDAFVAERTRRVVVELSRTLNEDIRGPTPHLVVSYVFTNGVLRTLVQIATAFCEPGIAGEVLGVLQLVVDNEEEAFLEDRGLADALPFFADAVTNDILGRQWGEKEEFVEEVRGSGIGGGSGGAKLKIRLVEVLFGVANAIRSKHLVLKAWFRPEQFYEDEDELTEEEKRTRTEDFPLFYLLLQDISANGPAGDFARMGILYIVEATSYSSALERWLIEGDMAALMASNMGALYSQLSRKLVMSHIAGEEPPMCKYGTIKTITDAPFDVEIMGSPEYRQHMSTFISSLNFWQDILLHSPFENVRKTLLDHFQYLFLQQVLYPSLLESSDADGGSSVAVTTYLRNMLQELSHPELVNRILSYLFGLPIKEEELGELATATAKARRRKSVILFSRNKDEPGDPSPKLFNLSDLINGGLKSRSPQTVTVTLRLLSTLLRRQHQQSLPHLLKTRPVRQSDPRRSLGGHVKEVDTWLGLAANITSYQEIEAAYEDAIYDNQNVLETHPCTYHVNHIELPTQKDDYYSLPLSPYIILPEDPITKSLISLLDRFLFNDIETNLDLTKVVLDIASCGHLRLEGWLITHPSKYIYRKPDGTPQTPKVEKIRDEMDDNALEDEEEDEAQTLILPPAREEPAWQTEDRSPILKSLDRVVAKAESFHRSLQDFDSLLAECRRQITSQSLTKDVTASQAARASIDSGRLAPVATTPSRSSPSTPARGHGRTPSLADRMANAFGTSPRQSETPREPSPSGPPIEKILEMQLSEATGISRPRSSGKLAGSSGGISTPNSSTAKRRAGRKGATAAPVPETPTRPSHIRHRSLRGEDLNASPSPRLDRRVVPGTGRNESEGSSLKRAIGNESDEDEEDDDDEEYDDDLGGASEQGARSGRRPDSASESEDEGQPNGNGSDDGDIDGAAEYDEEDDDDDETVDGGMNGREQEQAEKRGVTVGHLLTNVIILQEFILEIAALISTRGTTFGEIRFK